MPTYQTLKEYDETLMLIEDMIGANGSSNFQLDRLGENIFGPCYLGTYSSDKLPKYIPNEHCFIINNKSSRSKGEHWLSGFKRNGKLYLYDSLGRDAKKLSPYWNNKHIVTADLDRMESFREGNCGPRAMAWFILFKKTWCKIINVL